MRSRLLCFFWAIAMATVGSVVGAQPLVTGEARGAPESWLLWDPPVDDHGCGSAEDFSLKLADRLDGSPDVVIREAGLTISARIEHGTQTPSRWSTEIQVRRDDGTTVGVRRLEMTGESCRLVVDAMALALGLLLEQLPQPPHVAPAVHAVPIARPTGMTAATVATGPRADWAVGIHAGGVMGAGRTPGLSWGVDASAYLRSRNGIKILGGVTSWIEDRKMVGATAGVAVNLLLARIGLCPAPWQLARYTLDACAVAEAGRLQVKGFGFDLANVQSRWTSGVGAGAGIQRSIGQGGWSFGVATRVIVPFWRDQIAFADADGLITSVFRTGPVSIVGQLTLGYQVHESTFR